MAKQADNGWVLGQDPKKMEVHPTMIHDPEINNQEGIQKCVDEFMDRNGSKPHNALREFGRTDKLSKPLFKAQVVKKRRAWFCTKRRDEDWANPTDFQIREDTKLDIDFTPLQGTKMKVDRLLVSKRQLIWLTKHS